MGVKITQGYIYYFETRHRLLVPITDEVKMRVKEIILEMNRYYQQAYVPRVRKPANVKLVLFMISACQKLVYHGQR